MRYPFPTYRKFLSSRRADLTEWMDRTDCNREMLLNTYRYFPIINRMISRWHSVYKRHIRPILSYDREYRLLDVGSGGGDITRNIWHWAKKDGFTLDVTGIDPDSRALEFAEASAGIRFLHADTTTLRNSGETFDIVICNHVLHHLSENEIIPFLDDLSALASRRVICSDIERSVTGYLLFSLLTCPFFPGSYIRPDGLISIRRSFTFRELSESVPAEWLVMRQFPYRLLAIRDFDPASESPAE